MGGSIRRTSISIPEELFQEGQRLAKRRRRNFSNYVADLIAADAEKAAAAEMFFGDGATPGTDAPAKSSRRTFDRPL